jgi:hypothetical protein
VYAGIHKGIKEKEDLLQGSKESLRAVKKDNEDLNRKLAELQ